MVSLVKEDAVELSDDHLVALLHDPDNLYKWFEAIKAVEDAKDGITKKSPIVDKALLRSIYFSLLKRFPNLENYWILFSQWEFKLGNTANAEVIYLDALKTMPYSLKLWESYLRFRINLSNFKYNELKALFAYAELKIGTHYHSSLFWDLYLKFEETYNLSEKNKKYETFLILRKLIEIPIHNYAHFFQRFLKFMEDEISLTNMTVFLNTNDLNRVGILSEEKLGGLLNSSDAAKASALKEFRQKAKKIYNDLFIANQHEVFRIYQYEAKLKRQYFHVTKLSQQELDAWGSYLNYLEIKLLSHKTGTTVYKNLLTRIKLVYERSLISSALYDQFWVRYFWFYINLGQFSDARNVLIKSFHYLPVLVLTTKLLLVTLDNFNGKHFNARDYLHRLLTKFSETPEVWKRFLDVENIFFGHDPHYVLELMDQKLQNTLTLKSNNLKTYDTCQFDVFFRYILSYETVSLDSKVKLFLKYKDTLYNKSFHYWISLLKLLVFNRQQLQYDHALLSGVFAKSEGSNGKLLDFPVLKSVFNEAWENLTKDKIATTQLLQFYEQYIADLADDKSENVKCLFEMSLVRSEGFW